MIIKGFIDEEEIKKLIKNELDSPDFNPYIVIANLVSGLSPFLKYAKQCEFEEEFREGCLDLQFNNLMKSMDIILNLEEKFEKLLINKLSEKFIKKHFEEKNESDDKNINNYIEGLNKLLKELSKFGITH